MPTETDMASQVKASLKPATEPVGMTESATISSNDTSAQKESSGEARPAKSAHVIESAVGNKGNGMPNQVDASTSGEVKPAGSGGIIELPVANNGNKTSAPKATSGEAKPVESSHTIEPAIRSNGSDMSTQAGPAGQDNPTKSGNVTASANGSSDGVPPTQADAAAQANSSTQSSIMETSILTHSDTTYPPYGSCADLHDLRLGNSEGRGSSSRVYLPCRIKTSCIDCLERIYLLLLPGPGPDTGKTEAQIQVPGPDGAEIDPVFEGCNVDTFLYAEYIYPDILSDGQLSIRKEKLYPLRGEGLAAYGDLAPDSDRVSYYDPELFFESRFYYKTTTSEGQADVTELRFCPGGFGDD
ncbi:MAG: hypothetical protein M1823_004483 [Watsoniomyces obsoletus]|nr:MAG: hypothetical protein M1823_004483 [Watsoniomyces obsoletus]